MCLEWKIWILGHPHTQVRRKAKVRILNFKTTWSEFQNPSQTATKRGKAELRILNFKTTRSEFQKPSQTTTEQGEANLHISKVIISQPQIFKREIMTLHIRHLLHQIAENSPTLKVNNFDCTYATWTNSTSFQSSNIFLFPNILKKRKMAILRYSMQFWITHTSLCPVRLFKHGTFEKEGTTLCIGHWIFELISFF